MILELFTVLMALSFLIVYLGYRYNDKIALTIGWFFVFLLSLVLVNESLTYQTGFNETVINANLTTTVYNYTAYSEDSSHWIGYFLAVASSVGMILSWMFPNSSSIKND